MSKHRFYIEKSKWYVDLPTWEGPQSALEMVAGADDLLNRLSDNGNEVTVQFEEEEFDGYDDLLIRLSTMEDLKDEEGKSLGYGEDDGAVYEVDDKPIKHAFLDGQPNTLWLCAVTLFVFGYYPEKIYFKVV